MGWVLSVSQRQKLYEKVMKAVEKSPCVKIICVTCAGQIGDYEEYESFTDAIGKILELAHGNRFPMAHIFVGIQGHSEQEFYRLRDHIATLKGSTLGSIKSAPFGQIVFDIILAA